MISSSLYTSIVNRVASLDCSFVHSCIARAVPSRPDTLGPKLLINDLLVCSLDFSSIISLLLDISIIWTVPACFISLELKCLHAQFASRH